MKSACSYYEVNKKGFHGGYEKATGLLGYE